MKNLAYHILDIVQNSIRANANLIGVYIYENDSREELRISVVDNGKGMTTDQIRRAHDPYYTSRKSRNVGLGLSLFKQNAEQTGGSFEIDSEVGKGTRISAVFKKNHIDCPAKGDLVGTIHQLICGNTHIEFFFQYSKNHEIYELDTRELRKVLDGTTFYEPAISKYISEMIEENLREIGALKSFGLYT
jgi:hypothetical protein